MYKEAERMSDKSIKLADNAMLKKKPELFYEWNFEKNDELRLDIYKMTYGSRKKVWWLGECGHEWEAIVSNRVRRRGGCPYCSNKEILIGYNDIETTHPHIARHLFHKDDAKRLTYGSTKRVSWRCPSCTQKIKEVSPNTVFRYSLSCSKCSDGISKGEKYIYHLLEDNNIKFAYDCSQEWSRNKRYDFYLPEYDWIIEVHGKQHYQESGLFEDLSYQRKNDRKKEELALKHVEKYIILNYTDMRFLMDSLDSSPLMEIIKNKRYDEYFLKSSNSFKKDVLYFWENRYSIQTISEKTLLSDTTIRRYLKDLEKTGVIDDYSLRSKNVVDKCLSIGRRRRRKPVLQLNDSLGIIREWGMVTDVTLELKLNNVSQVCRNIRKSQVDINGCIKKTTNKC